MMRTAQAAKYFMKDKIFNRECIIIALPRCWKGLSGEIEMFARSREILMAHALSLSKIQNQTIFISTARCQNTQKCCAGKLKATEGQSLLNLLQAASLIMHKSVELIKRLAVARRTASRRNVHPLNELLFIAVSQ
jgi:hypothetical protein